MFMDVEEEGVLPWLQMQKKIDLERERINRKRINQVMESKAMKEQVVNRDIVVDSKISNTKEQKVMDDSKISNSKELSKDYSKEQLKDSKHTDKQELLESKMKLVEPISFGYFFVLAGTISLFSICFIVYQFLISLHLDISSKVNEKSLEMTVKVNTCAKQYTLNQCETISMTIPHMGPICMEWLTCMQSNPSIDRLSIFGHVFSQLVNAFINPLSWKAVTVTSVWLFICLYFIVQGFRYCKKEIHYHSIN